MSVVGGGDSQASALALAKRFHSLSLEYSNRPVVVRRGTIPSLLKLLRNGSWEVRHVAAQTVELLASHPENPSFMCEERGFVQALFECYKESEASDPELHRIFSDIFNHLRSALGNDVDVPDEPRDESGAVAEDSSIRTVRNRSTRVRQSSSTSKRLVVRVNGLQDRRVLRDLEDLLQTTRGVVSYTVDPTSSSATVFTAMSTATFLQLLRAHDFDVQVLTEESVGAADVARSQLSAASMPSYAKVSHRDPHEGGTSGGGSAFRRSLVLHGAETNTLAARVQREKEEERRKQLESQRSTVTGFLTKLAKSWW